MIYLDEMVEYTKRYTHMEYECLDVTAHLKPNSHIVNYDSVYLDNLLAWCVVNEATSGLGLPDTPDGYWIPIPVKLAEFVRGMPLWLTSVFIPDEKPIEDVAYHHKRIISGEWSKAKTLKTNVGRWMERRIPVPTMICESLTARVCGNRDEIARLLEAIKFLGKHRNVGYGEIDRWEVTPGEFDEDEILVINNYLTHAIPIEYTGIEIDVSPSSVVGWTPPQWKVSLQSEGWPIGTLTKLDWFDRAPGELLNT